MLDIFIQFFGERKKQFKKNKKLYLQQNHIFSINIYIWMNRNISLKKENQEQNGNFFFFKEKKKMKKGSLIPHDSTKRTQRRKLQSTPEFSRVHYKIWGIQEIKQNSLSFVINHICSQKALYKNVIKSPSIKSQGPISLFFPDIEYNYNLCLQKTPLTQNIIS